MLGSAAMLGVIVSFFRQRLYNNLIPDGRSMRILEFGEPLLRKKALRLKLASINSPHIQNLIADMQKFLISKKLGVGLAAPQIGQSIALAIIMIEPSKKRPTAKHFNLTIINPKILKTFGAKKQMWEGCISCGAGRGGLFALVPRYKKIQLEYRDENGKLTTKLFTGLPAHVIQHEIDHLNGVLFVDKVSKTKSYMTYNQYVKLMKKSTKKHA